jgi:hypothetical protein
VCLCSYRLINLAADMSKLCWLATALALSLAPSVNAQKTWSDDMSKVEGYPTFSAALDTPSIKTWVDQRLEGWGTLVSWDDHIAAFIMPDCLDVSHPPFVKALLRWEVTSQPMAELFHGRSTVVGIEVNCSERTSRTTTHLLFPGNNLQGVPIREDNPDPRWQPFSDPDHSAIGVTEASLCRK